MIGIFGLSSIPVVGASITLMAFFGPPIQNSLIHVSCLYPEYKSTFTSVITASFQFSSVIFLIFKSISAQWKISLQSIFFGYFFVVLLCCIAGAMIWPDRPFGPKSVPSRKELPIQLPSQELGDALSVPRTATNDKVTFWIQIHSVDFFHIALFFVVSSFWCNFYLGTLDQQLDQYVSDPSVKESYLDLFSLVTTLSAASVFFAGLLLDKYGFGATQILTISFGVLMSIGTLIPLTEPYQRPVLLATFVFYGLYRTFAFAYTFSAVAHVFGFQFFGTLIGIAFLVSGCIGFVQKPLAALGWWQTINQTQLAMIVLLYALPLYGICRRRVAKDSDGTTKDFDSSLEKKASSSNGIANPLLPQKRPTLFHAYGQHHRRFNLTTSVQNSKYGTVLNSSSYGTL
jgi:hypothetical protein